MRHTYAHYVVLLLLGIPAITVIAIPIHPSISLGYSLSKRSIEEDLATIRAVGSQVEHPSVAQLNRVERSKEGDLKAKATTALVTINRRVLAGGPESEVDPNLTDAVMLKQLGKKGEARFKSQLLTSAKLFNEGTMKPDDVAFATHGQILDMSKGIDLWKGKDKDKNKAAIDNALAHLQSTRKSIRLERKANERHYNAILSFVPAAPEDRRN
ncbi:hypothetical protein FRB96_002229 [Tulasnella sp. 330]|nr:hypothetical protein FRB96_002229 [Tulasnella sp. 330]KAG8875970.1 hypothetical protein FRB97_004551 [Tulasnella sp. 331]KAG8881424.1 hypothetical protein FRB98_004359 [Tulasnella sp. 332]